MRAETITVECEETGFQLVIETDDGERFSFRLPEPEEFYDTVRREIGPWLYERDLARMTRPEEVPYDVSDPKHPRHHDVFAVISDTKEYA